MDYLKIGSLGKSRGVKGELRLNIHIESAFTQNDLAHIFILSNGSHIPYFIESITLESPETIKFEDVDSKESAKNIAGKEIFINRKDLPEEAYDHVEEDYDLLIGFKVFDGNKYIGTLDSIEEYPQQLMANILDTKGNTFMIPLNDTFITDINPQEMKIMMTLPTGLY